MKQLALTASLCLLLAQMGSGCVVESTENEGGSIDNGNDPQQTTALLVTWNLVAGDTNAAAQCPAEAASVEVVAEPLDDGDNTVGDGDELYIPFACPDITGEIEDVAPGAYEVWVDVLDDAGELLAQSAIQDTTVRAGGSAAELAYTISLDQGSLGLGWTILGEDAAVTCEEAGAVTIWVVSTLESTGEEFYDPLDCADGQGSTRVLPLGSYQVEISLLDGNNLPLGPPVELQATLAFGNDYQDLGDVELQLGQ